MAPCELAELVGFWLAERPYLPWHISIDDLPVNGIFIDKDKERQSSGHFLVFWDDVTLAFDISYTDPETGPKDETIVVLNAHDPEFFEKLEALLIYATPQYPRITPDWIVSEEYEEASEDDLAWD